LAKNKKILIISENFFPEEFKINEVANDWIEKGYEVDVITQVPTYPFSEVYAGYKNKLFSKESINGINIYRVKAVTGYKGSVTRKIVKHLVFMLLSSMFALINGGKYKYIFGFGVGAFTGMLPVALIKILYKNKTMIWIQDVWPDSVYASGIKRTRLREAILKKYVSFVYSNTDSIAVSSRGFINKITPYLEKSKPIDYLPNWTDKLNINTESIVLSKDKKIHLTFAGNIGRVQNLKKVIYVFSELTRKYLSKAQLNIIGDGSEVKNLQEFVSINNIKNVVFHGKIARRDIGGYLYASDYLIISLINHPMYSATVPSKLQTYIAARKPIIAIINGETSEIVREYSLGYCADPDDVESIKDVFERAIENRAPFEFTRHNDYLTNSVFDKETIVDSLLSCLLSSKK
jgi:glycosyltransferase involved in cell wall biosynthesis